MSIEKIEKRGVQLSFDMVIGKDVDGFEMAEYVSEELRKIGFIVVGADFKEDMTELYKEMYHNLIK